VEGGRKKVRERVGHTSFRQAFSFKNLIRKVGTCFESQLFREDKRIIAVEKEGCDLICVFVLACVTTQLLSENLLSPLCSRSFRRYSTWNEWQMLGGCVDVLGLGFGVPWAYWRSDRSNGEASIPLTFVERWLELRESTAR
jgi:hypothetical protein